MNQDRVDSLAQFHPFSRLNKLLENIIPERDHTPLLLSVGEPQFQPPEFVAQAINNAKELWSKYPPTVGTQEFRSAAKAWLARRYNIEMAFIDADRMILPASGTREALFHIALSAVASGLPKGKGKVLMANPSYHVYAGAAVVAGGEPVFLAAGRESNFLPDPNVISPLLLKEAAMVYLCSPANPQGSVADIAFWRRWIELARQYDFLVVADECYSEIYTDVAPPGALEAAQASGSCDNLLIFHSLSKRSSCPGMRSGFVIGDARFISRQTQLISYGGVAVPLPILAASTLLWSDETHVVENRLRYQANFDLAQKALGPIFGNVKPGGGFFLWLNVGDGELAAVELWRQAAIKVLPGSYMARDDASGENPGASFIRVALVYEPSQLASALDQMAHVLGRLSTRTEQKRASLRGK